MNDERIKSLSLCVLQDARWRRGEAVSLKAARDSMVSLEVASHAQMYMHMHVHIHTH